MLDSHNTHVSASYHHGSPAAGRDWHWDAVLRRDRAADGRFVYGVRSTRIFCRPSCPSRRPRRDGVQFFDSAGDAQTAGFRPCKRCRPESEAAPTRSDEAIQRAVRFLREHADEPVSLADLARSAGLSAFHLQRRFKQAVGLSPREYQAACRADTFRRELRAGRDVAAAIYEAGYGSPSRVYESSPTGRGMSPAAYRRGGAGIDVGFVTVRCPLGWLLVAATGKGICAVKLGSGAASLEEDLQREFPHAQIVRDALVRPEWVRAVVAQIEGGAGDAALPLDVRGTAFQWRVWRALQRIQPGETRTYSDLARVIGQPTAVRAVARACATNPACLVIPCHRVVAKGGGPGGYRWGVQRKVRLLNGERKRSKIAPE
jgi:AraC family transcriptional regulator of adaptative response/methylated-DNA-[protein]-cysteine methyltransferase